MLQWLNCAHFTAIIVAFEQSFYSVSEGAGSVEVCLVIEQGEVDSENTVGVEIGVSPISHSIDYTATVGECKLAVLCTSVCSLDYCTHMYIALSLWLDFLPYIVLYYRQLHNLKPVNCF